MFKKVVFISFANLFVLSSLIAQNNENSHENLITTVQTDYFCIDGIYYEYDKDKVPFAIELGDYLETSHHTVKKLFSGGEYHITTLCPVGEIEKSHTFQSIIINQNPQSKIIEVNEKNRTVEKTTIRINQNNGWGSISSKETPIWVVFTEYAVILDDNTTYDVNIKVRTFNESQIPDLQARAWIQPGDDIIWGFESFPTSQCGNSDVKRYEFFFSDIQRKGQKINFNGHFSFPKDQIQIIGFKRFRDNTKEFRSLSRGEIVRLDKFGCNLTFKATTKQHNIYNFMPIAPGFGFVYKGHFYENGKRVFIFDAAPWCASHISTFYFTPI